MRRTALFVAALVAVLALLGWATYGVVASTIRDWFRSDVELRMQLAVESARRGLVAHWAAGDVGALRAVLEDVARDRRVMAVALCDADGRQVAVTSGWPSTIGCAEVAPPSVVEAGPLGQTRELPGGPVHVGVMTLTAATPAAREGHVVVLQDLSYLERRSATVGEQLLVAFVLLALLASGVTIVAVRSSWRGWIGAVRRALRGRAEGEGQGRFDAVVRDLEALAAELADARNGGGGVWNAERLRAVLSSQLQGERIVVVANREPYIHERSADGIKVVHPASGLVTALEPVMRACSGTWVAHGSGSADRDTVDARDRVRVPPGEESYAIRRVWLNDEEEAGYYYGFSNEGLWPLCHIADTRPVFRADDWEHYRKVNQRFADAVVAEVDRDDAIILVQDYHFALLPKMIRKRLPRATILTFWHTPWPNAERFGICPWREEVLEGLLGSSIVGFHTREHGNHFLAAVDAFLEARIDREADAVVQRARRTLIRPYPISIEWPPAWLAHVPDAATCRAEVLAELGLPADVRLGVGVDRLDYTKGIDERLRAVDALLQRFPEARGRFVFVQLAAPSRTRIERYRELNERVEHLAAEINARWSDAASGYRPIVLFRAHHEPPTVFRFYRAADVCYVSSLHDGMNLVAKEFVAAREDERGVLVLSQFTGAARELTEALLVNPYDLEQASDALAAALKMPEREQRDRMRAMRTLVAELNVYRWAGKMLVDAAVLRRRARISGKLSPTKVLARLGKR